MASDDAPQVFRVVLDTNVAVSGLLSPQGAAHAIIDLAVHHQTRLRLGASEENLNELLSTLRESRLTPRIVTRGLTPESLYMFYAALTDPAVPTTLWKGHWSSDPDDDAFLATAFAFGANNISESRSRSVESEALLWLSNCLSRSRTGAVPPRGTDRFLMLQQPSMVW